MKYFSVVVLFVVMYAVACFAAVAAPEDSLALADEKKTDKRGIYGLGYGGYGGYGHGLHGYGHDLGGHLGGHYGGAIGYPHYSGYSVHTPLQVHGGHGFYPSHGGFYHGFH